MFTITPYTPALADEWNRFVATSKNGTFLFDRRYMDYHADRFTDASLVIRRSDTVYALLPANRVGSTLYTHQGLSYGGLVLSDEATTAHVCTLFEELNAHLAQSGIGSVVYKPVPHVYHQHPAEEDLYALFTVCHARIAGRNVSSVIVLQQRLKWKRDRHYAANKARTNGLYVLPTDDYEQFWTILSDNLAAKFGARPVHSLQEVLLLHSRFPDNIRLYAAYSPEGKMLAGTVIYVCGSTIRSQYISATPEGKRLHAVDALYDHLINVLYAGARYFDLGTSNMPGSSDLHASLIYQKEGFGGRAVCCDTYVYDL